MFERRGLLLIEETQILIERWRMEYNTEQPTPTSSDETLSQPKDVI